MKLHFRKWLSVLLAAVMLLSMAGFATAESADGVFEGVGQGLNGAIKVSVTVSGGTITDVTVLEHSETAGVSDPAIEQVPAAIVAANSAEVDVVSGATFTSNGIMEAVRNALGGESEEEPAAQSADFLDDLDVIVVGGGLSGVVSTVRAAELGAKVLLVEQSGALGGSSRYAGGSLVGVNTGIENENGFTDSPALLVEDIAKLGGEGNYNPELAQKFAETCGEAVNWADSDIGVNFGERVPTTGGYIPLNVPRVHYVVPADGDVSRSSPAGGTGFLAAFGPRLEAYENAGLVRVLYNTAVTALVESEGSVVGVVATDESGETTYSAPSVILATGGYGANEALLKEYNFTNVCTTAAPTANGSGHELARSVGAKLSGMDWCSAYAGAIPVDGFTKSLTANLYTYLSPIWVNLNGERMLDEATADSTEKSDTWGLAPENTIYVIYNTAMIANPSDILYGFGSADPAQLFEELIAGGEFVFKADTIEDLAAQTGLPAKTLVATVNAYNEGVAAGKDSFGRTEQLISLAEGPFYAVKTIPYVMLTAGGPAMNTDAQILREDGTAIGGLYQAGELVGTNNIAGHSSVGGMAHGCCLTWGKVAAESAVANANK